MSISADILVYNAAITACEKSFQWKAALELLMETSTVVGEAVSKLSQRPLRSEANIADVAWRAAKLERLSPRDTLEEASLTTALRMLKRSEDSALNDNVADFSANVHSTAELCTMLWSAASVSVHDMSIIQASLVKNIS